MKKMNQKGKIDLFILGIVGVSVLIVGGVLLISYHSTPEQDLTSYELSDKQRPKIKVGKTHFDMGKISVKDEKIEEVAIENTGKSTLQVANFYTSCDCTSVQITINDQESPIFSMHNNPYWVGNIEPGEDAILKAIYEPYKMPVQGTVERTIFFRTNDPENPEVAIHFTAKVE